VKVALFTHSLLSDWNHGNAHFLRGVVTELVARGHDVTVWEDTDAWSVGNLVVERGDVPWADLERTYPALRVRSGGIVRYRGEPDLDRALDVDLVLVHEWNPRSLVAAIGARRARGGRFVLLFHDTHHRSVTAPEELGAYDLDAYDGVLAFGAAVRDVYERRGWGRRAWRWHEAADVRVFHPIDDVARTDDLVFVGNWGDDERTRELQAFLIGPAERLGLSTTVHGVRYPAEARERLARAGIRYAGWIANYDVPRAFARHRVTMHVPRGPYASALPGIPTIRPFEAMASGIPLVSAPWSDCEGLFTVGKDYLMAKDGAEMERMLRAVLSDPDLAESLAREGRRTVLARHTCGHRVDELLDIHAEITGSPDQWKAVV
jgi:spore maturation protein CgeB